MLECFLKAELWPASRIVACTRSLHKVQAEAAAGVVCTNKVSAAMQGCRVLVICCRADQLVNQAHVSCARTHMYMCMRACACVCACLSAFSWDDNRVSYNLMLALARLCACIDR